MAGPSKTCRVPFIDLVHPDDVAATVREFDRMVAAPDATLIEFRNRQRHRDGTYRWIEWSCQAATAWSFPRARRHEPSRRTDGVGGSLETTRAILDAVVDSIITIDEQFRVLDVSPVPTESTAFARRATRYELAQHCLAR